MSINQFFESRPELSEKLTSLRESFSKASSPLSFTAYAIKQKAVDEEDYMVWAQHHMMVPILKPEYFQLHKPDIGLWERWRSFFKWSPDCLPIAEWDGVLFVGCIEKPSNYSSEYPVCFVLSSVSYLENWYKKYQESQSPDTGAGPILSSLTSPTISAKSAVQVSAEIAARSTVISPIPLAPQAMPAEPAAPAAQASFDPMEALKDLKISEPSSETVDFQLKDETTPVPTSKKLSEDEEDSGEVLNLDEPAKEERSELISDMAPPPKLEKIAGPAVLLHQEVTKTSGAAAAPKPSPAPELKVKEEKSTTSPSILQKINIQSAKVEVATPAKPVETPLAAKPKTPTPQPTPITLQNEKPNVAAIGAVKPTPVPTGSQPSIVLKKPTASSVVLETTAPPKTSVPANNHSKSVFYLRKFVETQAGLSSQLKTICEPLKSHFQKYLLFSVDENENEMTPVICSDDFSNPDKNYMVPLKTPSLFYIVAATCKPFHGGISPNELNEKFFEDWNQGLIPDHATLVPLIFKDKLIGVLMAYGEKSAYSSHVLRYSEKIATEITKKLSESVNKTAA